MEEPVTRKDRKLTARGWHLLAILSALAGLFFSFYSLYHQRLLLTLGHTDAFCNISEQVNCDAVAASEYSHFLSIPWGVWGIGFFLGLLLLLYFSWRQLGRREHLLLVYALNVMAGCVVSVVLLFISWSILKTSCLICLGVHGVNLIQLGLVFLAFRKGSFHFRGVHLKKLALGLGVVILAVGLSVVSYFVIMGGQDTAPPIDVEKTLAQLSTSSLDSEKVEVPVSMSPYSGLGEDYRKGPDEARVKLVVFSDFQCPACKVGSAIADEVYQEFGGKIQIIYKNFPLDMSCNKLLTHPKHVYACELAVMARCAGRHGKFWDFHDLVYAKQSELGPESAKVLAKDVGLDMKQIQECLEDKSIADKVKDDVEAGIKLELQATPTFFINGRRFSGGAQEMRDTIRLLVES